MRSGASGLILPERFRYSSKTFRPGLHDNAPTVVARYVPEYQEVYAMLGWPDVSHDDRIYVNTWARTELGWQPRHDFASLIDRLRADGDHRSPLALAVGSKGYHEVVFDDGPYPHDNAPG